MLILSCSVVVGDVMYACRPYQHLFSSNRAAVAESYFPVITSYAKRRGGQEAAAAANGGCNASGRGLRGLPGAVHFTIQLAPGGLANSGDDGIHSNALFAVSADSHGCRPCLPACMSFRPSVCRSPL